MSDQFSQIKDLLDSAQNILILIPSQPELDILATASALNLSLGQLGKEVVLACPDLPASLDENLAGIDQVKTDINNRNLVVSFAYSQTAVEKVSYHIGEETNRFYLTVQPQKNQPPLDKNTLEVGYAGADADLIFLLSIYDYEQLEQLYVGNEQLFADSTVVALNNFEPEIGDIKLNLAEGLNFSSVVASMLRSWGLSLPADAATNLLLSIEVSTHSFASLATTPEVLETGAWLMRQGGRRVKRQSQVAAPGAKLVKPTVMKSAPVKNLAKKQKKSKPSSSAASSKSSSTGGLDHQPSTMSKSN